MWRRPPKWVGDVLKWEGSLLQFRWQESRLTVGGRKANQPTTWAELCRGTVQFFGRFPVLSCFI